MRGWQVTTSRSASACPVPLAQADPPRPRRENHTGLLPALSPRDVQRRTRQDRLQILPAGKITVPSYTLQIALDPSDQHAMRYADVDSVDDCAPCVAGKYRAHGSSVECSFCPKGHYPRHGNLQCQTCSEGKYSLDVGAVMTLVAWTVPLAKSRIPIAMVVERVIQEHTICSDPVFNAHQASIKTKKSKYSANLVSRAHFRKIREQKNVYVAKVFTVKVTTKIILDSTRPRLPAGNSQ